MDSFSFENNKNKAPIVGKIIKDDYHSMSTISCFISFVLLVIMKLYSSFTVAYQSVKNDKMMSAYMMEFVSYNVLDSDYINDEPPIEDIEEVPSALKTEEIIPIV